MVERNFLVLAALFVALWLGFNAFPQIDLIVSHWFYRSGEWMGAKEPFSALREIYYNGSLILALYLVVMSIVAFWRDTLVPKLYYRFFSVLILLGNFLIVNRFFKEYFGRARPYKTEEFGGSALFTPPPFAPVHQCDSNCSFVSGEASGAMIMILAFVALCGDHKWRKFWVWVAILPMAIMRVMAGKHFLSDVIMSMVLMAALYWLQLWVINKNSQDLQGSFRAFWLDFRNLFRRKQGNPHEP